jgi:hypothetical protein
MICNTWPQNGSTAAEALSLEMILHLLTEFKVIPKCGAGPHTIVCQKTMTAYENNGSQEISVAIRIREEEINITYVFVYILSAGSLLLILRAVVDVVITSVFRRRKFVSVSQTRMHK